MREGVYLAIGYTVISICTNDLMNDFAYVHFMRSVSLYCQVGLGNGGGARQHVSFDQNDDSEVSCI